MEKQDKPRSTGSCLTGPQEETQFHSMVQAALLGRVLDTHAVVPLSKSPLRPYTHYSDAVFKRSHLKFFMETICVFTKLQNLPASTFLSISKSELHFQIT